MSCEGKARRHGSEKGPLLACCVSGVGGAEVTEAFHEEMASKLSLGRLFRRLGSWDKEERPVNVLAFTATTFAFTELF